MKDVKIVPGSKLPAGKKTSVKRGSRYVNPARPAMTGGPYAGPKADDHVLPIPKPDNQGRIGHPAGEA